MRRLVKQIIDGMGLTEQIPFNVLSRRGLLFSQDGVKQFCADLHETEFDPNVFITDSLRRVLVGNENEPTDMTNFWRHVGPLHQEGAFLLTHHAKKPGPRGKGPARYRASGSTDIIAGTDVAFSVERATPDAATVECIRSRNAEELPRFSVGVMGSQDDPGT